MQVAPLDLQVFGRARNVPVMLTQLAPDVFLFERVAGVTERIERLSQQRAHGRRAGHGRSGLSGGAGRTHLQGHRGLRGIDRRSRHNDHQPLDQVPQLPDVSGPFVLLEDRHRIRGDFFHPQPLLLPVQLEKMPDQQRNILPALAEGRHHDRHDVQPIEEVFPKGAFFDFLQEILVRRGEDADIDLHQLRAADPVELLLLQRTQHLGLRAQAHVADLVQEQRPAVRLFELAPLHRGGAAEGALFMAEQLAFDQRFRNGGAIDGDEGPIGACAVLVNPPRHQFLAGPVLAADQDPAVGGTGRFDQLTKLFHRRRLSHQLEPSLHFRPQGPVFLLQPVLIERMLDAKRDVLEGQRLFDVVVGSELDGFDGRLDRPVPRHHHHLRGGHQLAHALEGFQSVHFRHPDVQQHEIWRIRREDLQRVRAALCHRHLVAFIQQDAAERRQDGLLVVHHQNRSRH